MQVSLLGLEILSAFVDRLSTRFKSYVAMGKFTLRMIVEFDIVIFFLCIFVKELVFCKFRKRVVGGWSDDGSVIKALVLPKA